MSHDTILTDDAAVRYSYENIETKGFLSGHIAGLNAAAEFLRDEAVTLFRDGNNDRAVRLRDLADEMVKRLRPEMERRCKLHEKNHPAIIEAE